MPSQWTPLDPPSELSVVHGTIRKLSLEPSRRDGVESCDAMKFQHFPRSDPTAPGNRTESRKSHALFSTPTRRETPPPSQPWQKPPVISRSSSLVLLYDTPVTQYCKNENSRKQDTPRGV